MTKVFGFTGITLAIAVLTAACERKPMASASTPEPAPATAPSATYVLARKDSILPKEGYRFVTEMVQVSKYTRNTKGSEGDITEHLGDEVKWEESLEALSASRARYLLLKTTRQLMNSGRTGPEFPDRDELENKPLLIDGSLGSYSVSGEVEGKIGYGAKGVLEIEERFNNDSSYAIYGKDKPRQPGERWEVHRLDLHEFCGVKEPRGSFSVEFVEIGEHQGTRCAVLKFTFDVTGENTDRFDWGDAKVSLKGEATCHRSLEDQVDLDLRVQGTRTIAGKLREFSTALPFKTRRPDRATEEGTFTYRKTTRVEKL